MRGALVQGYVSITMPEAAGPIERDTITCKHCQRIVFVKPGTASTVYLFPQVDGPDKEEPGAFCRTCMAPICLHCLHKGTCTPFERQIEQMEARGRFLRAAGV